MSLEKLNAVVFSDLHAHAWDRSDRPDRWKDFVHAIECVYNYAKKEDANLVVFCGDLFESKSSHSMHVWSSVVNELLRGIRLNKQADHVFVSGNHDLWNRHSVLHAIRDHALIADKSALSTTLHDATLAFVPYGCADKSEQKYDAVFTHCDFAGLRMRPGLSCDETAIDKSWLASTKLIINGHIHVQQKRRYGDTTVVCVGPPIPVNWCDLDDDTQERRGLLHIKNSKIVRVPFTWAPRFLSETRAASARESDFVRIELRGEDVDMIGETNERAAVAALSGEDLLREYVAHVADAADVERLLALGKKLYAGGEA